MVKEDFHITVPNMTMQHDFAMTEDYVIFLDFPLIANPEVGFTSCMRPLPHRPAVPQAIPSITIWSSPLLALLNAQLKC